jgi:hypothetical protein
VRSEIRMPSIFNQVLLRNMYFEFTEASAESDVLLFGELLVSKDDHTTIMENILDGSECGFIQGL